MISKSIRVTLIFVLLTLLSFIFSKNELVAKEVLSKVNSDLYNISSKSIINLLMNPMIIFCLIILGIIIVLIFIRLFAISKLKHKNIDSHDIREDSENVLKKLGAKEKRPILILSFLAILSLILSLITARPNVNPEAIQDVMKDAVLHNVNKFNLFGLEVNPAIISSMIITLSIIIVAIIIRLFVIPRFKFQPTSSIQIFLEGIYEFFENLGSKNSPHKHKFLNIYLFTAGIYIAISTLFELLGVQGITTSGRSISLPAPLSDINAAIALGFTSYLFIFISGTLSFGFRGIARSLKEFSLPISMSFRLFGALLSGLLVNELVYYYSSLSFVLPVVVAVLFTLIHAFIQAYILTTLTSIFYGEVNEPVKIKEKSAKAP